MWFIFQDLIRSPYIYIYCLVFAFSATNLFQLGDYDHIFQAQLSIFLFLSWKRICINRVYRVVLVSSFFSLGKNKLNRVINIWSKFSLQTLKRIYLTFERVCGVGSVSIYEREQIIIVTCKDLAWRNNAMVKIPLMLVLVSIFNLPQNALNMV